MPKGVYIRRPGVKYGTTGKEYSLESRKKQSLSHRGKTLSFESRLKLGKSICGKKHWNWKGGLWSKEEYAAYRRDFRKEDARKRGTLYYKKYKQRHTALKKAAGPLSIQTLQLIYEDNIKQYGTLTCYLCLDPIRFGKDTLEHKIPLSRGGTNRYNNLAIACRSCNCKKHDKTVEEWKGRCRNGKK